MMFRKIFAAIAALAALAACSTKESNTADSASAADSAAAAAAAAGAPNEVSITASEYAFAAPDQIPAGWTKFNLVDNGKQPHHATLFKLTGGKTFKDAADSLKVMKPGAPPPSWVVPLGGPNAVDPGGSGNAIVNLEAGNYMFICFLPDPTGAPHFTHGMMKGLTVTPATNGGGAAPAADITVTMSDYQFDWSKPLTAGTHTIEVKTAANAQPHEIQVFRLAPGKSQKDLTDWLGAMIQGKLTANTPPPASLIGGIAGMASGPTQYFTADFPAADYVVMCFIEDSNDHKPHFMHGMIQLIKVS